MTSLTVSLGQSDWGVKGRTDPCVPLRIIHRSPWEVDRRRGGRKRKVYIPAHGVFTLSQRAVKPYVQILHPFTARTFHTPHSCPCCSLCFPGHFSSFPFGNTKWNLYFICLGRLPFKEGVQQSPLWRRIIHYLLGSSMFCPNCVIPRPQFLPLSNGDLITNLPGLLWRVTEDNPPMLSYS